ncbi:DEAD/DEAH box helicase [Aspergillus saccharolyticus JOP 1030-1]|uniref:ATP-dependent RNA helicase n=1 Tax=Aspergillus saccharolyticus JOP 1030-1 TaxID=1450539 RepID=A0A319AD02_9EURO|nr:P-loop containing nucleoside triphosphate hydrolase protein [Aspergillus saccharolyticus JOP 1030-1]PYH44752.1 P-loop containing nucleoside triphosphate hydrolase protein [Aspergillus saccharolyticus JOP 1030-1]
MSSRRLLSQLVSVRISSSVLHKPLWYSSRVAVTSPTSTITTTTVSKIRLPYRVQHFTTTRAMEAIADAGGAPYSSLAGQLDPSLLKAIDMLGFDHMTPVQHRVMTELQPDGWRSDCLVQAKTGTGKTVAFLLPALHRLVKGDIAVARGQVAVLIITPTRELAQQIAKTCDQLTSQLTGRDRIECHVAVGGTAKATALRKFHSGDPKVLVATPGRLKDYLGDEECALKLKDVKTAVLDEADTMLEVGFLPDVKWILRKLPPKEVAKWQGMCFSATLPDKVKDVVGVVLGKNYHHISTIDQNESPTHERVPQYAVVVPDVAQTFTGLQALLQEEMRPGEGAKKVIVFGATANLVGFMYDLFKELMPRSQVFEMHSRMSQAARTRTTQQFKEAKTGVMFASDVVGRGMDFPNVDLVVQVGLPADPEQYVHRVGRTARAGNDGRAVILLTKRESFFINANAHKFPIKPHPKTESLLAQAGAEWSQPFTKAIYAVDESTKARAYQSFIGYLAGSGKTKKQMQFDNPSLVQYCNELAIKGMGCPEQPGIKKSTIAKMGLKGVPGFIYASEGHGGDSRPRREHKPRDVLSPGQNGVEKNSANKKEPSRKRRGPKRG